MEAKNKKYITLAQAAKTSPYSQEYLSLLARQGKLQAKKFGRNWYITESALNDYLNNQGLKIVLPKHLFNTADKGKITQAILAQFPQEPIDLSGALENKEPEKKEEQAVVEPVSTALPLQPSLIKTMQKDIMALGEGEVAEKPKIFKTIISQLGKVLVRTPEKIPKIEHKK